MAFDQGYADALAEIETLRQELATWSAAGASAMAEVEALKADLAKATKQRVGEQHNEPCACEHPDPRSLLAYRCVKPRGHDVHWNGQGDVWVPDLEGLVRERDEARDERDAALAHRDYAAVMLADAAKARNEEGGVLSALLHDVQREHDRLLRTAAQHAVDVYRQGNVMGTVVAVDRLGEVLDGGT